MVKALLGNYSRRYARPSRDGEERSGARNLKSMASRLTLSTPKTQYARRQWQTRSSAACETTKLKTVKRCASCGYLGIGAVADWFGDVSAER